MLLNERDSDKDNQEDEFSLDHLRIELEQVLIEARDNISNLEKGVDDEKRQAPADPRF
jgi:hypothetical protein